MIFLVEATGCRAWNTFLAVRAGPATLGLVIGDHVAQFIAPGRCPYLFKRILFEIAQAGIVNYVAWINISMRGDSAFATGSCACHGWIRWLGNSGLVQFSHLPDGDAKSQRLIRPIPVWHQGPVNVIVRAQRFGKIAEAECIFIVYLLNNIDQPYRNTPLNQELCRIDAFIEGAWLSGYFFMDFRRGSIDADLHALNKVFAQAVRHFFINEIGVGEQFKEKTAFLGIGNNIEEVAPEEDFAAS